MMTLFFLPVLLFPNRSLMSARHCGLSPHGGRPLTCPIWTQVPPARIRPILLCGLQNPLLSVSLEAASIFSVLLVPSVSATLKGSADSRASGSSWFLSPARSTLLPPCSSSFLPGSPPSFHSTENKVFFSQDMEEPRPPLPNVTCTDSTQTFKFLSLEMILEKKILVFILILIYSFKISYRYTMCLDHIHLLLTNSLRTQYSISSQLQVLFINF